MLLINKVSSTEIKTNSISIISVLSIEILRLSVLAMQLKNDRPLGGHHIITIMFLLKY